MTGWLVEPSNSKQLADKILEVLKLPNDRKDVVGTNARRRVEEKFGLRKMLNKTLAVYNDLLSTKKNINN